NGAFTTITPRPTVHNGGFAIAITTESRNTQKTGQITGFRLSQLWGLGCKVYFDPPSSWRRLTAGSRSAFACWRIGIYRSRLFPGSEKPGRTCARLRHRPYRLRSHELYAPSAPVTRIFPRRSG